MPEFAEKLSPWQSFLSLSVSLSLLLGNSPTQELNTAGKETSKMCDRSCTMRKKQRRNSLAGSTGPLFSLSREAVCWWVCGRESGKWAKGTSVSEGPTRCCIFACLRIALESRQLKITTWFLLLEVSRGLQKIVNHLINHTNTFIFKNRFFKIL